MAIAHKKPTEIERILKEISDAIHLAGKSPSTKSLDQLIPLPTKKIIPPEAVVGAYQLAEALDIASKGKPLKWMV